MTLTVYIYIYWKESKYQVLWWKGSRTLGCWLCGKINNNCDEGCYEGYYAENCQLGLDVGPTNGPFGFDGIIEKILFKLAV